MSSDVEYQSQLITSILQEADEELSLQGIDTSLPVVVLGVGYVNNGKS